MNVEYECLLTATLLPPVDIGAGPFGMRRLREVSGGTVEGKRVKGKILTGGGDWLLIGTDGFARLDVRTQFLTDDGASIFVYYHGLLELNQKVGQAVASNGSTEYRDQYFRSAPRFETGDTRYAWLNQSMFVAEGRFDPSKVVYKIYRVV